MHRKNKPLQYRERGYRSALRPCPGLTAFSVGYRETDLWIQASCEGSAQAQQAVLEARMQIEAYGRQMPAFLTTLAPLPDDPLAFPLVRRMLQAGRVAGVGPMAAVAGAIAQYVGERLLQNSSEVLVENGGDLFLAAQRPLRVGVFAGGSPLDRRIGLRIKAEDMPLGVGTSSASVGHSLSYGSADAACVVARDAALADAAATGLGNRARSFADLHSAIDWAVSLAGVQGALLIRGEALAVKGDVELVAAGE
jgi:ApbE superfamily uncharacterized protein (UPF0280 family)